VLKENYRSLGAELVLEQCLKNMLSNKKIEKDEKTRLAGSVAYRKEDSIG
jgi:hypothetical protein